MLSIGSMSQDSGKYYMELAQGDYYTRGGEPPGQWLGTGAAHLGLVGQVEERPFYNVLEGLDPEGSTQLVRCVNGKAHHPGWDLTFSAPKSLSVIWSQADYELRQAIQQCQQQAVTRALAYLEEEVAVTRRGKGGHLREGADLVIATFEHGTSRAEDPQLHTHALVLNLCVREDGTIGGLAGQVFYRHKMVAGALYRAELAALLRQRLGFEIVQHSHSFEIQGVPQKLITAFSKRRQQIIDELKAHGVSSAQAAGIAAMETRTVKRHLARELLQRSWRSFGLGHGFSTEQAEALAKGPRPVRRPDRVADLAAAEAVSVVMAGRSFFTEREMLRFVAEECSWRGVGADEARAAVKRRLKAKDLVPVGEVEHEAVYTTKNVLAMEREMLRNAGRGRNTRRFIVSGWDMDDIRRDYRRMTDGQKAALEHITTQAGAVKLVNGLAGTGKTTLLKAANEAWSRAGFKVVGLAVSGKAAYGLQQGSGIESMTIASLRIRNDGQYREECERQRFCALHRLIRDLERSGPPKPVELDRDTILVLDEASMVSTPDLAWLVAEQRNAGAKLVLVGDDKQLPAIEAGGGFGALFRELGGATMTEIRRQKEPWARQAVEDMANGRVAESLQAYHEHGLVTVTKDRTEAIDALLDRWRPGGLRRPGQHVIFATTNQEVELLNRTIQEERRLAGRLGHLKVRVNGYDIRAYDRVMFTENSPTFKVANGMTGTVLLVEPFTGNLIVWLDSGGQVAIPLWRYNSVVLGYAMTAHKGQGSTVKNSYILMGGAMQDREMAYVQVSRAEFDTHLFINELEAGEQHQDLLRQLKHSRAKQTATTVEQETAQRQRQDHEQGYGRER